MTRRWRWNEDGRGGFAWAALAAFLGLLTAGNVGCSYLKALALVAAPTEQKVAPEYKDLPGKRVLVYVWAERDIQWEYTKLRLDLSAYLASYLERHVKNLRTVDPLQVERHVEQQRTFELDPVELGRHFKADVVIHVSVFRFSIRDPEMAHFYRGRMGASVQVHDLTRTEGPERVLLRDVNVTVPEEGPLGLSNATAAQVRQATYDAFTVEAGKKFHEWQRPVE